MTVLEQPAESRRAGPVHLPGDTSMWVFVLGDLVIFGVYFIVFMVYRTQEPAAYLSSQQHLSVAIGAVNTLVLLTSSQFVALGVQAARAAQHSRASRLLALGGLCGGLFVLIKAYEWYDEASRGYTLSYSDFFSYYYVFTGTHLLHVFLGLGILGVVLRELRTDGQRRIWVVEAGATFWHMVDLLWVLLFALLYVMR